VVARMDSGEVFEIVLHRFAGLTSFRHAPDTARAEFRIAVAGPVASFLLALVFLGLMAAFNSLGADIMARLRHEPETPRAEFRIAVAGPAASFLIALFFLGVLAVSNSLGTDIFSYLALTLCLLNFLLAVFNMFPGYPLDGGRVLRAYLWRRGTDLNEATILTGKCGQIIAAVLIFFGLFIAFGRGDFFTGCWTILVGLFLYDSAQGIIREVRSLERQTVESAMRMPVSVMPDADVQDFVDRILSLHRRAIFPVAENRQLYGMLVLEDLKKLPREDWRTTKIQTIMRPLTPDYFIEADASLAEANRLIGENDIGALGVIDAQGNLVGFLNGKKVKR
ncbi:MAG: site-2 protease family protein, partial [Pyrinomonadaceae bacterium]|nr:site-2 protease family protein [Pyrinomonadaceae bacterium]